MRTSERKPLIAFQGKLYTSLSQAAEDIGLAPTAAYRIKKEHEFTNEEVLQYYVEQQNKSGGQRRKSHGRNKSVVIDGVEYASYTEALRAYHIPRVTVTSKMRRKNIDFETALMEIISPKEKNVSLLDFDSSFVEPISIETASLTKPQTAFLHSVEKYFQNVQVITYKGLSGIQFDVPLNSKVSVFCYTLFSETVIWLFIPDIPTSDQNVLTRINLFNRERDNCCFGYRDGKISASWALDVGYAYPKFLLRPLSLFLDECSHFCSDEEDPEIKVKIISANLIPGEEINSLLSPDQEKTYKALKDTVQTVSILKEGDVLVFSFPFFFKEDSPTDCFLYYQIRSHKLVIPKLISGVNESQELYERILAFNQHFVGCKIWFKNDHIGASWNVEGATKGFFGNVGPAVLNRFLEGCRGIVREIEEEVEPR